MIVARIGALCLLIAYGFAAASVARLMYVTASEGYSSWVAAALFIAPAGILGLASAGFVLARHPLGRKLAVPLCVVLFVTAAMTLVEAPPVGGFLEDYERAALARGVDVPPFEASQGTTARELIEGETSNVKTQGAIGAIVLIIVYVATVLRTRKPADKKAPKAAQSSSA